VVPDYARNPQKQITGEGRARFDLDQGTRGYGWPADRRLIDAARVLAEMAMAGLEGPAGAADHPAAGQLPLTRDCLHGRQAGT